jgi:hypothetical protein
LVGNAQEAYLLRQLYSRGDREEVAFYQADPIAYEAQVQATSYSIPSMIPNSPRDIGRLPPEIEKIFLDELPQSHRWEEWSEFAQDMDGFGIARQLGVDLSELFDVTVERYRRQGSWKGGFLDLRLTLFYAAWQMRHDANSGEETGILELLPGLVRAVRDARPSWSSLGSSDGEG